MTELLTGMSVIHGEPYTLWDSLDGIRMTAAHGGTAIDQNRQVTLDGPGVFTHWGTPLKHGWTTRLKIPKHTPVSSMTQEQAETLVGPPVNGRRYPVLSVVDHLQLAAERNVVIWSESKRSARQNTPALWASYADVVADTGAAVVIHAEQWAPSVAKTEAARRDWEEAAHARLLAAHQAGFLTALLWRGRLRLGADAWAFLDYVKGPRSATLPGQARRVGLGVGDATKYGAGCSTKTARAVVARSRNLGGQPARTNPTGGTMILNRLALCLREAGLKVVETDGWKDRGHGPFTAVDGVACHHTAGPASGNMPSLGVVTHGRAGLAGPLCNLGLGRDGTFYVVAAGIAYHAGVVKRTEYDNRHMIGIEAEATGHSSWPEVQMDAYARGCAALAKEYGFGWPMVKGHKEICSPQGRKVDPNFDMGAFRTRVARAMSTTTPTHQEDDMPYTEQELQKIVASTPLTLLIGSDDKPAEVTLEAFARDTDQTLEVIQRQLAALVKAAGIDLGPDGRAKATKTAAAK